MSQKKKQGHKVSSSLWGLIPFYLTWQIENRDLAIGKEYEHVIRSMNLSILLNLNSMIEGYIEDLLLVVLNKYEFNKRLNHSIEKHRPVEDRLFERRLITSLVNRVDYDTWNKLIQNFELILGKPLSQIVENETWKSIKFQFVLRNMIAHGNTISVEYGYDSDENETVLFNKKWDEVQNYLVEKNLIDEFNPRNPRLMRIFENKVIDHFVMNSIKFIEELNGNIKKEYTMMNGHMILKYLDDLKKRYDM